MRTLAAVTTLFAAILILSACRGPYVPVGKAPSVEDTEPVVLLDKSLKKRIAVDRTGLKTLADGRVQVVANLRNRTSSDLEIQVQTVFKDRDGVSTQEDSAWEMRFLAAHETETYELMSRGTNAEKYTIRIREVR